MANADNAAAARMGKLKKEATELGIPFGDDISEETLREAIKLQKEAIKEFAKEAAAQQAEGGGSVTKNDMVEIAKVIGESIAKANRQTKEEETNETYDEPDPSEFGEFKTYYTPMFFWILPAKRIAGRLQKAPYGKIVFHHDQGSAIQVGTQWQTRYISTFTTNNKKVQAYMETHPRFGKQFFLSSPDVTLTNDQTRHAQFFAVQLSALERTMAPQLYAMAAELGANTSHNMSLHTLRTIIAEKLADHDMARYKREQEEAKASVGRDALLTLQSTK